MFTDYKFWYIKRDDEGFITEAAVRFYEGEITTQTELTFEGPKVITRYRRSKRLTPNETPHKDKPRRAEADGNEAVVFFPSDFGKIKTDEELRVFLNGELAKDLLRQPIGEQRNA